MLIIDDCVNVPAGVDTCFELKSGNVYRRQEENSSAWELFVPNALDSKDGIEQSLIITQKELSSVHQMVVGVAEKVGTVAFSDNQEIVLFSFLLVGGYSLDIHILWESYNPYELVLRRDIKNAQTFDYPQKFRFKFAHIGGKKAENAKGIKLTIFNDFLMDYKKQVLEVVSWKRNDMETYRHEVKRTKATYTQVFANDLRPLEL